jgi:hypothetical protein
LCICQDNRGCLPEAQCDPGWELTQCTHRTGSACCTRSGGCNPDGNFIVANDLVCPRDTCLSGGGAWGGTAIVYLSCEGMRRCEEDGDCPGNDECLFIDCCGGGVCVHPRSSS